MPEITAHYSENLPSSKESYKTRRFSCELKQVASDNTDITAITQRLFMIAKANVRSQVESAKSDLALGECNTAPTQDIQAPSPQPASTYTPQKLATEKQISYLLRLARKNGLSYLEIRAIPSAHGKTRFEELSAKLVSSLIDSYNAKKAA